MAGGTKGRMYASADGINWTELQTPVDTDLLAVGSADAMLIAHGANGDGVASSDNGATWETFIAAIPPASRSEAMVAFPVPGWSSTESI